MKSRHSRSDIIHYEGMTHAPENELGVVFLFGKVHKLLGFTGVDEIKPGFPDCWAWRRGSKGSRRTWIEFEFRSSGFSTHVKLGQTKNIHPKKGFVVCWEHNWPECEKHAQVIDLRAIVEHGPRVWIQSVRPEYQDEMDAIPYSGSKRYRWTVAPRAKKGDLLLLWRAGTKHSAREHDVPEDRLHAFTNILEVMSPPKKDPDGFIRSAEVRRVANLRHPLHWGALKSDALLKSSPFVQAQMQGQWDVTGYWWRLYSLLLRLNPALRNDRRFKAFDPHRFW